MRALDLFSAAAGGWTLGLHRAGFVTVAACEIVEWRRILYAENNPHVVLYEDVRTVTATRLVSDLGFLPDIIVGSPPCQDISVANTKGRGIDCERSGLYLEAVRLVGDCRPRWFAFENSAHLRTRGADRLLDALATLGYACEPCVVGAGDVGANHVRRRSWLIGFDPAQLGNPTRERRGAWRPGRRAEPASAPCQPPCGDVREAARRPQAESPDAGKRQTPERVEGADRRAEPASHRRGNAADAGGGRLRKQPGRRAGTHRAGSALDQVDDPRADEGRAGDVADADEARPADGRLEPGLRSPEIPLDGRGDERRDEVADADRDWQPDRAEHAEMGGREGAGGAAQEPWADWNGGLAGHLWMDDGISAWVAGTRIALGDGKRASAASLIVEAFGDAVLPQIPEAIGRAILRTEQALDAVLGLYPASFPSDGGDR